MWQDISSAPKDKVILTNDGTAIWSDHRNGQFLLCDGEGIVPQCADWGSEVAEILPTRWMHIPEDINN